MTLLPIRRGAHGADVVRIQRKIGVTADGDFGPATEKAVQAWQKAHHLTTDGIVGERTWGAMFPPAAPKRPARLAGRRIGLGIGHGIGNRSRGVYDPGACAGGLQEHVEVQRFVVMLDTLLRHDGAKDVVVADTPLGSITAKMDAFSVDTKAHFHINAGGGHGAEMFVPLLATTSLWKRADACGRAVASALGLPYRGTKRTAHLAVVKDRNEAMLFELFFIDNPSDRAAWKANFAKAVVAVAAHI